jgi:nitric oxide reductase NorD protein
VSFARRSGDGLGALQLVASAIAGRSMDVTAAPAGERSWCDGATIFIEVDVGPADQIQMLAVQASLAASGSLEPGLLTQFAGRAALARRYLAVEAHRALLANDQVLPPGVRPLIDRPLASSLATPQATLDWVRGRRAIADPPRVFGSIEARRALLSIRRTTTDPLGGPTGLEHEAAHGPTAELDDVEDDSYIGDLLSSPVGGGGGVGRLLAKLLRPTRRRGGGGPPGADTPTHKASARSQSSHHLGTQSSPVGDVEVAPAILSGATGMRYPEWDEPRGRYRPDWCTVLESDVATDGSTTMVLSNGLAEAMRRSLARLGTGLTRCRRQTQGDDVDIDAAIETYLDTVAGVPHGADVYCENRRRRRDLGVLILLDVSGSAGEPGVAGRSVHEHQRLVAAALAEALHDLGDRIALYAFNSRGRQSVQSLRVMGFNDHYGDTAIRRLSALQPTAYTRMGAAIRHATAVLDRHCGTPRRLLVMLSDGFAYDHGYEGRYGEADARRALTEARRIGVGCVCLSVGASTDPEALRRVFGSAAHATVARPDELPGLIAPLFRSALRSAEGQHRVFQQKERRRERLEIGKGRS